MIFLKLTRTAKNFFTRFGWLIAELVFVFLGLYGAFLLERMHDEEMDQMRKRQILQALVDEFADYETELSTASTSLDEGYGIPFFTSYSAGERPFPSPIPYGGMGSVNTGIWEAMLQSGGIEVLEVEIIQKVQVFFKKLQDLLDLYSRFERLSETMILPEMDQDTSFFYEKEVPELRDKFKWYVNSLYTIGMSLRELSEQASDTKDILIGEYEKIRIDRDKISIKEESEFEDDEPEIENEEIEEESVEQVDDIHFRALSFLAGESRKLKEFLILSFEELDTHFVSPFLSSYDEGKRPVPVALGETLFPKIDLEPVLSVLKAEGIDSILEAELLDSHRLLVDKLEEVLSLYQDFDNRCQVELSSEQESNSSQFYPVSGIELKDSYTWYPNTLFTLKNALDDCRNEATGAVALLDQTLSSLYPSADSVQDEPTTDSDSETDQEVDSTLDPDHE